LRAKRPGPRAIARLNEHPERCFADRNAWNAHLETLGISSLKVNPDPVLAEGRCGAALFRCDHSNDARIVLLRHKFRRMFRGNLRAQHGQRGSILAIATTIAQWTVAIELGMGRSGGAAGSVTTGNGRFREPPGGTWS
jgi:hypothetical protein